MKNHLLSYVLICTLFSFSCHASNIEIANTYTCMECHGESILKSQAEFAKKALIDISIMINDNHSKDEISKMIYLKYGGKVFKSIEENMLSEMTLSISKKLRCLECSKQILSESQSQFADNVKAEIRNMLTSGMTESDIFGILGDKYGDDIFGDFHNTKNKIALSLLIFSLLLIFISMVLVFYIRNIFHYLRRSI